MIRVAVIGTGNIAPSHVKSYLAFPGRCKIVALVDIFPEKAEKMKKDFGLDAEVFDSHRKLLGRSDIDLVDVCTPPFCHAEIAIDFLNDGKNVITEKPMSSSLEECDRMIAAAEKSGKVFSVIAQNRFRDPIMNLKHVLDNGMIGRVVHAQVDSRWWRGHCYYDLWWRGLWSKEGGGCTLNHAVHHIDMLIWMMGLPKKVVSLLSNAAHDNAEVEDISVSALQYDNGAVAQLTASVVDHGEDQQIIFQGEKARVSAPWEVCASTAAGNGFPRRNEALEQEIRAYYDGLPHLRHIAHEGQIDNVMTAIETGDKPMIGGRDGRATIELITAIYKAGIRQSAVNLPIRKDDIYYTAQGIQQNAPHFYEKTGCIRNQDTSPITYGSDYGKK